MNGLDVNNLITETNKQLKRNQQIHPDDPILASVVLNNEILNIQVNALNKKLDETICQLTAASEQQIEKAKTIAEELILSGGNNIEKQLDMAAQRWEERLKQTEAETEKTVRWATWLAWTGAVLIIISVCVIVGSCMGNFLFTLVRHVK